MADVAFNPALADALAGRWLIVEVLAGHLADKRERDALVLAVADAKAAELRLLESARVEGRVVVASGNAGSIAADAMARLTAVPLVQDGRVIGEIDPSVAKHAERWAMVSERPWEPHRDARKFTNEEKIAAVRLAARTSHSDAADQLGIRVAVLRGWTGHWSKEYREARAEREAQNPPEAAVDDVPPADADVLLADTEDDEEDRTELLRQLEEEQTRPTPRGPWTSAPISRTPVTEEEARRRAGAFI